MTALTPPRSCPTGMTELHGRADPRPTASSASSPTERVSRGVLADRAAGDGASGTRPELSSLALGCVVPDAPLTVRVRHFGRGWRVMPARIDNARHFILSPDPGVRGVIGGGYRALGGFARQTQPGSRRVIVMRSSAGVGTTLGTCAESSMFGRDPRRGRAGRVHLDRRRRDELVALDVQQVGNDVDGCVDPVVDLFDRHDQHVPMGERVDRQKGDARSSRHTNVPRISPAMIRLKIVAMPARVGCRPPDPSTPAHAGIGTKHPASYGAGLQADTIQRKGHNEVLTVISFSRRRKLAGIVAGAALAGLLIPTTAEAQQGQNACERRNNNQYDKLLECVTLAGVREHQAAFQAIADANGGTRADQIAGVRGERRLRRRDDDRGRLGRRGRAVHVRGRPSPSWSSSHRYRPATRPAASRGRRSVT